MRIFLFLGVLLVLGLFLLRTVPSTRPRLRGLIKVGLFLVVTGLAFAVFRHFKALI